MKTIIYFGEESHKAATYIYGHFITHTFFYNTCGVSCHDLPHTVISKITDGRSTAGEDGHDTELGVCRYYLHHNWHHHRYLSNGKG